MQGFLKALVRGVAAPARRFLPPFSLAGLRDARARARAEEEIEQTPALVSSILSSPS